MSHPIHTNLGFKRGVRPLSGSADSFISVTLSFLKGAKREPVRVPGECKCGRGALKRRLVRQQLKQQLYPFLACIACILEHCPELPGPVLEA